MDNPLGKYFSGEDKNTFVEKNITPKNIIKINAQGTTPHKEKYFLIVNVDKHNDSVEGFYINSQITDFAKRRPQILELNLGIKSEAYPFIKKESFIDFSQIKNEKYSYIYTDLIENPSWVLNPIEAEDLKEIKNRVNKSSLYSPKDKDLINKL